MHRNACRNVFGTLLCYTPIHKLTKQVPTESTQEPLLMYSYYATLVALSTMRSIKYCPITYNSLTNPDKKTRFELFFSLQRLLKGEQGGINEPN